MLETEKKHEDLPNDIAPETPLENALEPDLGEIEGLEAEVSALRSENQLLKDQALRYAAEAENVKRRAEREMNDARAFAITRFARDLLGVADILDRAVTSAPKEIADPAFKNFVLGIEMTEKEMVLAFDKNGLKRIAPLRGDRFDPNLHQAVTEVPGSDVEGGSIVSMMQTGYELFGRIIRPAMVAVASRTTAKANHATDGES
jgi:molecular chaperone GrpE